MADTTILIRNPEIERLAERTGKPADEAVADAVRAQLGKAEPSQDAKTPHRARIAAALAKWDALPHAGAPLTDADLYDENGLPR